MMFYYCILVHILARETLGRKRGRVKGAYVNVLISFPDPRGAKRLAKIHAAECDKQWRFRHFTSCRKVTLADFKEDPEYQAYFAEAKRDGYSVFYCCHAGKNRVEANTDAASFMSNA
jgi:hypothetical protein